MIKNLCQLKHSPAILCTAKGYCRATKLWLRPAAEQRQPAASWLTGCHRRSLSISLHWGWVKLSFHTLGMALLSPSPKQCFRPHWLHCFRSGKNWNHWSVSDRNFALGYSRLFVSSCTPGVSSLATAAKSLDFIPGAELNELRTCQFCVPSISGIMIHFFCFAVCHSFHSAVAKLVGDHCLKFARKSDGRFMHIMRALAICCSIYI